MANVIQIIIKGVDNTSGVLKKVQKELGLTDKQAKLLGKAWTVMSAGAVLGVGALIVSSTKLAARVETLGVVTVKLGENIGWSEEKIRALEQSLIDTGITLRSSRQSIAMMIQANVDLAKATDIARLAQDAAVIAGVNSSEAFQKLIYVIQTGNVRMARTLGLQVNFKSALQKTAKQLGKTTEALTEEEIMLARTNAVMEAGARITGTYEAAMETAGKQMLSLDRYVEEFKVSLGNLFIPVLADAVEGLTIFFKTMEEGLVTANLLLTWNEQIGQAMKDNATTYEEYVDGVYKAAGIWEAEYVRVKLLTEAQWNLSQSTETAANSMEIWRFKLEDVITEVENLKESIEGLTEAELLQMAVEAMIAGDYALAQHYMDLATKTELFNDQMRDAIVLMDAQDGRVIDTKFIRRFTDIFTTKIITRKGRQPYGRRQYGGPVSADLPYLVGEGGPELFVPNQTGKVEPISGGAISLDMSETNELLQQLNEKPTIDEVRLSRLIRDAVLQVVD